MSGSGGDGFGGSGGSGGLAGAGGGSGKDTDEDPCDITETAPLNSPQPAVVATLAVGSRLTVTLATGGARPTLQVDAPAGTAGSLTHRGALAIANCIRKGNIYEAEVLNISGGQVLLRIERA